MVQSQGNNGSLKELWIGVGISLGIYLLGLLILFVIPSFVLPYMALAFLALIVLPIVCFASGKKRMGQGALIGIGLNILLFTACSGILLYNLGG